MIYRKNSPHLIYVSLITHDNNIKFLLAYSFRKKSFMILKIYNGIPYEKALGSQKPQLASNANIHEICGWISLFNDSLISLTAKQGKGVNLVSKTIVWRTDLKKIYTFEFDISSVQSNNFSVTTLLSNVACRTTYYVEVGLQYFHWLTIRGQNL